MVRSSGNSQPWLTTIWLTCSVRWIEADPRNRTYFLAAGQHIHALGEGHAASRNVDFHFCVRRWQGIWHKPAFPQLWRERSI